MNDKNAETPQTNPVPPATTPATNQSTAGAPVTMKGRPVSAFSLFSKSFEIIQKNIAVFGILFIPTLLSTIIGMFNRPETTDKNFMSFTSGISTSSSPMALASLAGGAFILLILFGVLNVIVAGLTTVAALRGSEGKTLSLGEVWNEGKHFILRILGLGIVTGLLTVLGFICLIVPGVILLRRYFLAPYLLVDKNLGIGEAMKQSGELSKPFSGAIYGVIGVNILLAFTGIVPVIGALLSTLLAFAYSVAPALRYQELKGNV